MGNRGLAQEEPLFYTPRDYGTAALMNPLWIILNGSYDIIQHENRSRSVFTLAYGAGTRNVVRNLGSPLGTISRYGWGKFLRTEVLPLSFSLDGGQWWPNYTLHLVGGGMTYRATEEWYTAHGFGEAWAWSLGTMATYHLLNEIVENSRRDPPLRQ